MDDKAVPFLTSWRKLLYRLICLVSDGLARLGFRRVGRLGDGLGSLMWRLLPRRRAMATRNIAARLDVAEADAARVARDSFAHTGRAFAEIVLTPRFGLDYPGLRFGRPDLWEAIRSSDRPVVGVTAHYGAWELLAPLLGALARREPCPAAGGDRAAAFRPGLVVVRRYNNSVIQAYIARQRQAGGATMVGHRRVAGDVLRALRHNGIAAFLVDHSPLPGEALFLPFLGEVTGVNQGPALLAVRAEAVIWPIFLRRENGAYVFEQQEPLDTRSLQGSREEKISRVAEFYTKAVETMIRACPEQWFWLHNRWKSKPPSVEKSTAPGRIFFQ